MNVVVVIDYQGGILADVVAGGLACGPDLGGDRPLPVRQALCVHHVAVGAGFAVVGNVDDIQSVGLNGGVGSVGAAGTQVIGVGIQSPTAVLRHVDVLDSAGLNIRYVQSLLGVDGDCGVGDGYRSYCRLCVVGGTSKHAAAASAISQVAVSIDIDDMDDTLRIKHQAALIAGACHTTRRWCVWRIRCKFIVVVVHLVGVPEVIAIGIAYEGIRVMGYRINILSCASEGTCSGVVDRWLRPSPVLRREVVTGNPLELPVIQAPARRGVLGPLA